MKFILKMGLMFLAFITLLGFGLNLSQPAYCNLEDLIVQDKMMPSEWKRLWRVLPPALPKHGAQDALNVVYENGSEIAQHTVFRYRNGFHAFLFLRVNHQLFFPSGLRKWIDLAGSGDWGLNGDEESIRCGDSDDPQFGYKCSAVVRYGLNISDFSSPVGEEIMSQEDFKRIVISIDDRFSSCYQ